MYLDQLLSLRNSPWSYASFYLGAERRLLWLEHNVYWALRTADEYVWFYSERANWWNGSIPEGAEAAIRSAREKQQAMRPLGFEIEEMVRQAEARLKRARDILRGPTSAPVRRVARPPVPPASRPAK